MCPSPTIYQKANVSYFIPGKQDAATKIASGAIGALFAEPLTHPTSTTPQNTEEVGMKIGLPKPPLNAAMGDNPLLPTPVQAGTLKRLLKDHPLGNEIWEGFALGFKLGYTGQASGNVASRNSASVYKNKVMRRKK